MHDPDKPQLWVLVGGNGAGKITFYQQFLKPRGLPFVNADLIAKDKFFEDPESKSREAAQMAEKLRYELLDEGKTFCFETVFSHAGKIDFIAAAKARHYETILVFIHLEDPQLNVARVKQRVNEGGHNVPEEKIAPRIKRLEENVQLVIEHGLATQVHIMDNSDYENPYVKVLSVFNGNVTEYVDPLPNWATRFSLAST